MSTLRDILLQQKDQTNAKIERLATEAEGRRQSWMESASALEAAKNELHRIDLLLEAFDQAVAKSEQPTIMQAVLDVLKHRPEGMTALEILAEINSRYFDGKYVRTSLSPQLSRLKDRDRKITLRGNRWFLLPEQPSLFTRKS
jgi:hypothetical protein